MLCGCCLEIHDCLNFEFVPWSMPRGLGACLTQATLPVNFLTFDCLLPCPTGPPDPLLLPPGASEHFNVGSARSGPGEPLSSLQPASDYCQASDDSDD